MKELREQIEDVIQDEPVALFMKGTPEAIMCGNSHRALTALNAAGAPVTTVDILPDPRIRQELSALSGWPTIPQVFVKGELIGGRTSPRSFSPPVSSSSKLDDALGASGSRHQDGCAGRAHDRNPLARIPALSGGQNPQWIPAAQARGRENSRSDRFRGAASRPSQRLPFSPEASTL